MSKPAIYQQLAKIRQYEKNDFEPCYLQANSLTSEYENKICNSTMSKLTPFPPLPPLKGLKED